MKMYVVSLMLGCRDNQKILGAVTHGVIDLLGKNLLIAKQVYLKDY